MTAGATNPRTARVWAVERIGESMSTTAFALIAEHLSADDDPQLWQAATMMLLAEAAQAAADSRGHSDTTRP
jgi:hypothetical protein